MSIKGKFCLITGATSGHGRAVATALARQGAQLILHGRNETKCRALSQELAVFAPEGKEPQLLLADLSRQEEVERAAEVVLTRDQPLHLLVNNAGGVFQQRRLSPEGHEMTLAVNYLAPFALTLRLAQRLIESAPSRIVIIASEAYRVAKLDMSNIELERGYHFMRSYGLSKRALIHLTIELARRLEGSGVTVNCLDPGPVRSNIGQNNPGLAAELLKKVVMKRWFPPAEEAARTAVHVSTSPALEHVTGRYFRFMAERPLRLDETDPTLGQRLWDWSVEQTGVDLELS